MSKERWHKTFMGQGQQHTYWLYKVIDDVVESNPQLCRFIEIGTGNGALSIIFALHALRRDTCLYTLDIEPRHKEVQKLFRQLGVVFDSKDCFSDEEVEHLKFQMGDNPTFFFCDGGDKAKEFNFFAPIIPSGSVICAHDYSVEIHQHQIQKIVDDLKLVPLFQEEWTGGIDDIQTCFYLKS